MPERHFPTPTRLVTRIVTALAIVASAVGLIAIGRATVDTSAARNQGYASGRTDGEADGQQIGRALQVTMALPPDLRTAAGNAFNAGYTAGANDVFSRYDGGWDTAVPYAVVLEQATGGIAYRIASSTQLQACVNYYLCPHSKALCHEPRR